ncbi:putative metal ion ABC transporter, permease protein [Enterococcus faecalis TX1467]|nr:putative metal ion ABC transporter, permease protein [Enterococcus faecalis TX1467]
MLQNFINGLYDFHFLQNALITSVVIGIVSGTVGCFIILRGMSLMGDAISHAVLPGVAISYILGINFFIGAIVFGLLASIIITFIKSNSVIKGDTAIGITFSSFLALGVILIGVANSSTDLFHILFGNILAVQDIDKWITIGVSVLVLVIVVLFFKELLITSFAINGKRNRDECQFLSLSIDGSINFSSSNSYAKCGNYINCCNVNYTSSYSIFICK